MHVIRGMKLGKSERNIIDVNYMNPREMCIAQRRQLTVSRYGRLRMLEKMLVLHTDARLCIRLTHLLVVMFRLGQPRAASGVI